MENPEGVLNLLDEFAKLKSKEIPNDLEEYLSYVAASGDPVYQWSLIKSLYRQKLINVITEFYEVCPLVDIPRCPNVDPFNYETMKNSLLKRLDSFSSAPFTIQRISELLTTPRKQYNRVDKFMRAIEKNIWVVSTREPGTRESSVPQETSTTLVNGVTPRVCVMVKHPKRVKSIEERIKSGHPQLIDDEEDEEGEGEGEEEIDEYEPMEEESNTEILTNSEADDSSLQCTSVKDLIEKYENGTIFSNPGEKTDFEEKSAQLEASMTVSTDLSQSVKSSTETLSEITSAEPNKDSIPIHEEMKNISCDAVQSGSEQKAVESFAQPDSNSDSVSLPEEIEEIKEKKLDDSASDLKYLINEFKEKTEPSTGYSSPNKSEVHITVDDSLINVIESQSETTADLDPAAATSDLQQSPELSVHSEINSQTGQNNSLG